MNDERRSKIIAAGVLILATATTMGVGLGIGLAFTFANAPDKALDLNDFLISLVFALAITVAAWAGARQFVD